MLMRRYEISLMMISSLTRQLLTSTDRSFRPNGSAVITSLALLFSRRTFHSFIFSALQKKHVDSPLTITSIIVL